MTNEEIIEGTKIIAAFYCGDGSFETYFNPVKKFHFALEEAEYHSSWDWLMPVVEKIEALGGFTVSIQGYGCVIDKSYGVPISQTGNFGTKISAVWNAVIGFIQWYNQNKQPTINHYTTNEIREAVIAELKAKHQPSYYLSLITKTEEVNALLDAAFKRLPDRLPDDTKTMDDRLSTDAFKAGYEKRVCEQLQRALDGLGQNSAYNSEELDKAAKAWAEKHCR